MGCPAGGLHASRLNWLPGSVVSDSSAKELEELLRCVLAVAETAQDEQGGTPLGIG